MRWTWETLLEDVQTTEEWPYIWLHGILSERVFQLVTLKLEMPMKPNFDHGGLCVWLDEIIHLRLGLAERVNGSPALDRLIFP